jgi:hypothetical protein
MDNLPIAFRLALMWMYISALVAVLGEALTGLWRRVRPRLLYYAMMRANHRVWSWVVVVIATKDEIERLKAGVRVLLWRRMQSGMELSNDELDFFESR